ncbi:MAG: DHHA1 domain-containing protein [Anaerolineales bacterium]
MIAKRFKTLKQSAALLKTSVDDVPQKVERTKRDRRVEKEPLRPFRLGASRAFIVPVSSLQSSSCEDAHVLAAEIPDSNADALRLLADKFREKYPKGGVALLITGSAVIAVVTEDLVKRGLKAGDLINGIGGKGGGRPNMAQGSLTGDVQEALGKVAGVVEEKLK